MLEDLKKLASEAMIGVGTKVKLSLGIGGHQGGYLTIDSHGKVHTFVHPTEVFDMYEAGGGPTNKDFDNGGTDYTDAMDFVEKGELEVGAMEDAWGRVPKYPKHFGVGSNDSDEAGYIVTWDPTTYIEVGNNITKEMVEAHVTPDGFYEMWQHTLPHEKGKPPENALYLTDATEGWGYFMREQ